jgi:hypothetical protein
LGKKSLPGQVEDQVGRGDADVAVSSGSGGLVIRAGQQVCQHQVPGTGTGCLLAPSRALDRWRRESSGTWSKQLASASRSAPREQECSGGQ